jgi:DNA-binding Xre family transcriptional regulator
MSSPELVLQVLRAELRAAGITYKALAERIGMSESSVKRMFGQKDMALSRLAQICKATGIAMDDVLRQAADVKPHSDTLTLTQEKSLMANPRLLLVAICCLGHWTIEQVIETYCLSEPECIGFLAELDRLGVIELKPMNRYSLRVSNAFRWLPDGPSAQELVQKIQQLAGELARLHQNDRRLDPEQRDGFTLLLGFRSWEFAAFTALRRPDAPHHQIGPRNTYRV